MDGPTLRAMAEALVMDLSALGHSLKPPVREGFVAIVPDSNDGRAKRAILTRGGIKKLKVTTGLWQQAQSRFDVAFGGKKSRIIARSVAQYCQAGISGGLRGGPADDQIVRQAGMRPDSR
jgi:DNA-binding MarR family transcriptional regulator